MNKHIPANKAFGNLLTNSKSQMIQISGVSGAGKTETAKHIIQFLCKSASQTVSANIVERIECSTILLEAFGNATTISNGNSSRFSKVIKVCSQFLIDCNLLSTYILCKTSWCFSFLLHQLYYNANNLVDCDTQQFSFESSRVCTKENFHIFRLIYESPEAKRLLLNDQTEYEVRHQCNAFVV